MASCAQAYYDTHVVKMILGSVQILCTVLHESSGTAPYRSTHRQHPCVIWAGSSLDNWIWLSDLVIELNKEYVYRVNKEKPHQSFIVAQSLQQPHLPALGMTERPLVMPEEYIPIGSYRQLYAHGKRYLLKYTKRKPPYWLKDMTERP